MRVAVLTDIHANGPALEAALEAVGDVDQLWVLGDMVGYGPHPNEVVERLRGLDALAVQGNHDAAVLGRIPLGTFNGLARAAVQWTAESMTPENLAWLADQVSVRWIYLLAGFLYALTALYALRSKAMRQSHIGQLERLPAN